MTLEAGDDLTLEVVDVAVVGIAADSSGAPPGYLRVAGVDIRRVARGRRRDQAKYVVPVEAPVAAKPGRQQDRAAAESNPDLGESPGILQQSACEVAASSVTRRSCAR